MNENIKELISELLCLVPKKDLIELIKKTEEPTALTPETKYVFLKKYLGSYQLNELEHIIKKDRSELGYYLNGKVILTSDEIGMIRGRINSLKKQDGLRGLIDGGLSS